MNTTTTYAPLPGADRGLGKRGWASGFLDRLLTARQRAADRRIAQYLRGFSDENLRGFNLDASTVARLRRGGTLREV